MKRDFEQQRANELVDAFLKACAAGTTATQAMRNAARMPCSRFWISTECVCRRLNYAQQPKGKWLRMMMQEIERRLDGRRGVEAVEMVIYSAAPQFYMAGDTARKIIQRELKRRRRCRTEKR